MLKMAIGFVAFAAVALYFIGTSGEVDMGGEKHGTEAVHAPPSRG